MNNLITSYIRTYTPMIVGAFLGWVVTLGIEVDEQTKLGLISALTVLFQGAYYAIIRQLERKFPQFGWLLGSKSQPDYKNPDTTSKKTLE